MKDFMIIISIVAIMVATYFFAALMLSGNYIGGLLLGAAEVIIGTIVLNSLSE